MVNIDYLSKNANYRYLNLVLNNEICINKPLSYKKYKNGVIYTTNDKGGYNIHCLGVWKSLTERDTTTGRIATKGAEGNSIERKQFPSNTSIKHSEEKVIYIGSLSGVWGHFITDSLRSLWFLKSPYFDKYKDYKIVYTTWCDFALNGNFKQLLELFGIDFSMFVEVREPTSFSEIIVPDPSFLKEGPYSEKRFCSKEYLETINTITYNYQLLNYKPKYHFKNKVYFSSRLSRCGRFIGEEKIESFLKKEGFAILYPEKISFFEQLYFLSNCDVFASTDGSCSHNSIFAKKSATILIIPRSEYLTPYQAILNQIKNNEVYYIDSCLSFLNKCDGYEGPFYFYASKELYKYFGKEINGKKWVKTNFKDANLYIKKAFFELRPNEFEQSGYALDFYKYYSEYAKTKVMRYLVYKIKRKLTFILANCLRHHR